MDLMQILQDQISGPVLHQVSNEIGADPAQTQQAATGIFATLLGGLANNTSTESGLSALGNALDRDHDGSMLDDIAGMVGGMLGGSNDGPQTKAADGMGILGHILGDRQEVAAEQVSQSSGLSMGQVMKLMPILAPIVMSVLGKARSQGGLDLGSIASVIMGSAQNASQQGGMGDLIGSVLGGVLGGPSGSGGGQQGGSLSGILGGIFGRG